MWKELTLNPQETISSMTRVYMHVTRSSHACYMLCMKSQLCTCSMVFCGWCASCVYVGSDAIVHVITTSNSSNAVYFHQIDDVRIFPIIVGVFSSHWMLHNL